MTGVSCSATPRLARRCSIGYSITRTCSSADHAAGAPRSIPTCARRRSRSTPRFAREPLEQARESKTTPQEGGDGERRTASRQGYRIPLRVGLDRPRALAKTAMEMPSLWKPQNGFHSDLEISPRTRDSHIPTAEVLRENEGEQGT